MDPIKGQMMNNMNKDDANYNQAMHNQENKKVYKSRKRNNFWLYVTLIIIVLAIISALF